MADNKPRPSVEKTAFSIDEFCFRNNISRGTYYNLKKEGRAPRVMTVGTRQIISEQAESDWQRAMEGAA
jgi:hypothetical protein